jgi:hypothetical protein
MKQDKGRELLRQAKRADLAKTGSQDRLIFPDEWRELSTQCRTVNEDKTRVFHFAL